MKKLLLLCVFLTGCASGQYDKYADSQLKLNEAKYTAEIAKHSADQARYLAISEIAKTGTEASKVAAVMGLAMGQMTNQKNESENTVIQAPRPSELLQWAQIIAPAAVQTFGILANKQMAINQSNNAAAVAQSTNSAFVGIAGKIQSPAANVTTTTTTTSTDDHTQLISGSGTIGSGAYTTTSNPTTSTLSGTGTLGSGAYTTPAPIIINPPVFSTVPVVTVP